MPATENAKIIITVPAIDVNNAVFAVFNFPGSPWAAKNKTPVITQSIITIMVPTVHTTFATFCTIPVMVMFWANAIAGRTKTPSKTKKSIFLFTPLEVCLYITKIVIFRQPIYYIMKSRFASAERPLTGFICLFC